MIGLNNIFYVGENDSTSVSLVALFNRWVSREQGKFLNTISCVVLVNICLCIYWLMQRRNRRRVFTNIVELCRTTQPRSYLSFVRSNFRWSVVQPFSHPGSGRRGTSRSGVSNHAHPSSANARCQATTSVTNFIESYNNEIKRQWQQRNDVRDEDLTQPPERRRYDVATSSRETKFNCDGERLLYDTSDLSQEFKSDELTKDHIVSMIDVDFHLEDWTRYHENPVIIYTRIPDRISARTEEGFYRLDVDDEDNVRMTEHVAGGAIWTSSLWDYSRDRVIIQNKWKTSFTVMAVEKIPQPNVKGRWMVFLAPIAKVNMPYFLVKLLGKLLFTPITEVYPEISHANNVWRDGDFILGNFQRHEKQLSNEVDVRYRDNLDPFHSSMPYSVYKGRIAEIKHESKVNNLSTMQNRYGSLVDGKAHDAHPFIWNTYFQQRTKPPKQGLQVNYICKASDQGQSTSFEEGRSVAEVVSPPMGLPGVAPTQSRTNDVIGIDERVVKVRNEKVPPSKYETYREEYTNLLISKLGDKIDLPELPEILMDKQIKPAQVLRNETHRQVGKTGKRARVKAFPKPEVIESPKPARNISTVLTEDTIELGCYVGPLKKRMANLIWFMPGQNPTATSNSIHEYCKANDRKEVVETDYSKFDGTISPFLRTVEASVLTKSYTDRHTETITRLLERDMDLSGKTSNGVRYKTKASRLSGSQMTTVGNSVINAYVAYCAYRLRGHTPERAFGLIGPKFGDDGIDDKDGEFELAAEDLGLDIKIDVRSTTNYVTFCGRIYLNPKFKTSSIFKPMKALRSLPLTTGGKCHSSKIKGYLVTDSHTPFISHWCKAINRCHGYTVDDDNGKDSILNYIRKQGPFPWDEADLDFAFVVVAEQLGLDVATLYKLCADLDNCQVLADLEALSGSYFPDDKYKKPLPGVRFVEGNQQVIKHRLGVHDAEEGSSLELEQIQI